MTCDLTERMLAARSDVVISPRSSTSLPTTSAVMTSGYSLVSSTAIAIWARFLIRLLREPDPLDHLQPDLGGQRRNLVEPVLDRIGPHAVGDLGELRQILRDLFRRDLRGRHQRRLRAAERRVGNALQLGVGIDRRARKRDRRGQPPPHGRDHT